jgi:hypothetical protein
MVGFANIEKLDNPKLVLYRKKILAVTNAIANAGLRVRRNI